MYCKKCGKQYPNDVKFCGDCGVPLEEDVVASKHFPFKIVIPVVAAVLAVAVGVGAFFFIKKGDETDKKDETTVTDEVTYEQEISSTNELADLIASLNSSDYEMATIDVFAENYSPADKDENAVWDPILFYALEGYEDNSGYISKNNCDLIRKQLRNASTGNIIQYEIYINPNSGKPNKIVSIENVESGIDVMEYYFTDDSKINFIFMYSTDNYVTTYATPDKDGQRFLFNNDSLCTWRFIQDGEIANFVCGQNEADRLKDSYHSNQIYKYSDLNDEQKNQVDTYEKQMINAAYNTLNTVMAADGIATISGMAVDSNGNALANATVDLFGDDFSTELFSCTTDDTGAYNILVPVSDYNYNITVSLDGCLACSIFDILINATNIEAYPDTAYLVPQSDSDAEVQLTLGDAANYADDGETLKRLSNAVINVRAGINNKLGDILYTFNSDENGYSAMSVKAGVYTIEVQATGYESMYYTIVSNPTVGTSSYSFYAAPELAEGQLAVVLTWGETPNDLDSHLFTSSGSDTQQVWYSNRSDDYGNWLDVDDTSSYGPETITISQFDTSKYYKYCVVDFSNSSAGNSYSTEMSYSGANVSVYNSNGLIASYNMPKNVNALVWEVFEIRNGVVSPIQRCYNNNSVENNYWWDGNDDSAWAQAYYDFLNSKTEEEWVLDNIDAFNYVDISLCFYSENEAPFLIFKFVGSERDYKNDNYNYASYYCYAYDSQQGVSQVYHTNSRWSESEYEHSLGTVDIDGKKYIGFAEDDDVFLNLIEGNKINQKTYFFSNMTDTYLAYTENEIDSDENFISKYEDIRNNFVKCDFGPFEEMNFILQNY
ncbi:hypothetical protein [Pseudobutyrivibrio sp.]|uniref:hypothetical protein n=1 Tax=Pseudobutyrivibrio sp. TaxID=2014367 RepID=UPI001E0C0280|nr:hypothetical protein [Pseudobutyrivibrio sp.]MBE5911682.1 hypothetical protein [Pseudobutyrivibrio sp.]